MPLDAWACEPSEIDTGGLSIVATFGKAEREAAAWLVVRLFQVKARAWGEPFLLPEFVALAESDKPTRRRLENPFFRPDFRSLVDDGLLVEVEAGNPKAGAHVSPEFVRRCDAGPCGRRAKA